VTEAGLNGKVVETPPAHGDVPLWIHPEWQERFPWLVQGTTGRGDPAEPFDLGLSGEQPVGAAMERWRRLLQASGLTTAVHARQVHGTDIHFHRGAPAPGVLMMSGVDGHVAAEAGLLLTASVADCVPVFLIDAERRAIGLLHAGWRGVAGAMLERGVSEMGSRFGSAPHSLWMHCGPAICGPCYPVGGDVHAAVNPGLPPVEAGPLDLRAALLHRAQAVGLSDDRCSVSAHCTRCTESGPVEATHRPFFSHRGSDAGRQMAVLGVRAG